VSSRPVSNSRSVPSAGTPSQPSLPAGTVIVYTDGSSFGNPGPSGWAWIVNENCWAAGGLGVSTNQRAELFAVLAALRAVPRDLPILIRTDSKYTLNSCTAWMRQWKARGWRKADGSPVQNLPLMKELDLALRDRQAPIRFEWVRGHSGDRLNEAADARCTAASRSVQRNSPVPSGPGWTGTGNR
jgi:ribonuclease HI